MTIAVNMDLFAVNVVQDDNFLGAIKQFRDVEVSGDDRVLKSCATVTAVYVKNTSGGTIARGLGVTFKASAMGKEIGGLSAANGVCDGVVPYYIPGTTIANNAYFWLIINGPARVEIGVGDITAGAVAQTLASGKFGTGTLGTNPVGHSGRAIDAGTSGNTARIIVNNPFSAYCSS